MFALLNLGQNITSYLRKAEVRRVFNRFFLLPDLHDLGYAESAVPNGIIAGRLCNSKVPLFLLLGLVAVGIGITQENPSLPFSWKALTAE